MKRTPLGHMKQDSFADRVAVLAEKPILINLSVNVDS